MKLSIIIPYYKTLELTTNLLDVLVPQLNEEVELIIVDDGCFDKQLDDYVEYLCKNVNKNAYIIMCKKENGGVSSARNMGLNTAIGEYVAFVDSDDLVREDYVKQILMAIKNNLPVYKISWESFGACKTFYDAENLPDWNVAVWVRIIKRNLVLVPFNENMKACEDKQFLLDNGIEQEECGYINEYIYKYNSGRVGSLSDLYL